MRKSSVSLFTKVVILIFLFISILFPFELLIAIGGAERGVASWYPRVSCWSDMGCEVVNTEEEVGEVSDEATSGLHFPSGIFQAALYTLPISHYPR